MEDVMRVDLTEEAIQDIATFYGNTGKRYYWDEGTVQRYISNTIDSIIVSANQTVSERTPLLVTQRNNGNTEQRTTKDKKWYFTTRIENDVIVIENAMYYANMSNQAYRRGTSNPNANLQQDDRSSQSFTDTNIKKRTVTETQLKHMIKEGIIMVLKELGYK